MLALLLEVTLWCMKLETSTERTLLIMEIDLTARLMISTERER
jgi:hypothetical protein